MTYFYQYVCTYNNYNASGLSIYAACAYNSSFSCTGYNGFPCNYTVYTNSTNQTSQTNQTQKNILKSEAYPKLKKVYPLMTLILFVMF